MRIPALRTLLHVPSPRVALLPGLALAGLGGLASALPSVLDGDHAGAPASLATTEAVIGGVVRIELAAQRIGSQALLAFGLQPTPVLLGASLPVLQVGLPFAVPAGVVGADGRFAVDVPIAPAYPAGVEVYVQGAVLTTAPLFQLDASAPVRLAPGGPAATLALGALPAATSLHGGADVDWADVDKDGYDDVLVANYGPGARMSLLRNQGGAGFVDEAALRLPVAAQVSLSHVEAADVDLDGDLDLFLGAGGDAAASSDNLLALNDGAGYFTLDASFPAGQGTPVDAEFGDIDGDGYPDLFVASAQDTDHPLETPDGVTLYRNVGGLFVAEAAFALTGATDPHTSGGSVALGDADRDGDLDLFIARADTALGGLQNQLLVNDGAGVFTDITPISIEPILDNSFEAEFADLNGDGWLDLVVANSITATPGHHYLLNLGVSAGTGQVAFNDVSTWMPADFGGATKVRIGVEVADVDGDGDVDVLYAIHQLVDDLGQLDGDAVLLLNQGGLQAGTLGTFAVDAGFDVGGSGFVCSDAAFGDADHDGDLDLYLASDGDLMGILPPSDVLLLTH